MKSLIRISLLAFALGGSLLAALAQDGRSQSSPTPPGAYPSLPAKIDYRGLTALLAEPGNRLLLLDVRTREEFSAGHLPEALLAPYDGLAGNFRETEKGRPIVVYCRSGRRSAIAATTLRHMGYTNVSDFGALDNWRGGLAR